MVTINPADVQPGEVWLVAAPEGHTGAWIGVRCEPEDDSCYPWRLVRTEGNGTTVYRQDSDVTLLDRLVPVRPVTRGDLPTTVELVESWGGGGLQALAAHVLDVVVDRLNGCGGVPGDADRWRRALSIVERERDEARAERDAAVDRADALVHDLEWHKRRLGESWEDAARAERERDEAVARAEAAEARTAPAVTKRELRSVVGAHDPGDDELAVSRVNALTYRLWSLVSGADPAVFVVRESDLPVAWRDRQVWRAGQSSYFRVTPEDMRSVIPATLGMVAARESVARAIEAEEAEAVDPVEELAGQIESATRDAIRQVCDTFATVAPTLDPLAVEQAMEVTAASRKIAAHVLGQEDNLNAEFETTREHITDTRYVHLPCPHCGWHP